MYIRKFKSAAALTMLAVASGSASADLSNPGFETGDFSDWFTSGAAYVRDWELSRDFIAPVDPNWTPTEGAYFASLWSYDPALGSTAQLSQTFAATAGQTLSFDYFFDYGDANPNYDWAQVTLTWGANGETLVEHNTPGHLLGSDINVPWTHITHVLPASDTYTLTFMVSDSNIGFESILGVDNVHVVPEPTTALLLLACLTAARRR
jgi:hypothetical protein